MTPRAWSPGPLLVAIALLLLLGRPALAGRTHYGWMYGTEIIPERTVEVETWILEENGKGGTIDETLLWWGPVVGVTEHLEIAVPVELAYEAEDGAGGFRFLRWGADLRYRFDSPDPLEAGAVTTLARVAVKRLVEQRKGARAEADLVIAFERGRVHGQIDLGLVGKKVGAEEELELRPGAGVSLAVTRELRLGAEVYAELGLVGDPVDWLTVGPTLGWTAGRFWLSGTFGVGVFGIDTAPRINMAVAF